MTSLIMKTCKSPYIYSAVQAVTNLLVHSAPHSTIPSGCCGRTGTKQNYTHTHTHTHTHNK